MLCQGSRESQRTENSTLFHHNLLLINFVASKSLTRLFWPKILPGPAIKSTLTLQIYFYQINCPKICLKLAHKKIAQLCLMQAPSELRGSFHPYCLHPLPRPVLNKEYNTMMMMQILYWGDDEVDHHHVWHFRCDDHNVHMTSFCTILSWKGNDIRKSYKRKDQVKFD